MLAGTNNEESLRIESIIDFCFSALHTVWGADCTCAYPLELSKERARAHYCRDRILPILQTLRTLFRPRQMQQEEDNMTEERKLAASEVHRKKKYYWVAGKVNCSVCSVYRGRL